MNKFNICKKKTRKDCTYVIKIQKRLDICKKKTRKDSIYVRKKLEKIQYM